MAVNYMDVDAVLRCNCPAKHRRGREKWNVRMRMYQRATKLYIDLFHHQPNLERPKEADQYARLETALREVVHDCKTLAEQHGTGGPQGLWGGGLTTGRQ